MLQTYLEKELCYNANLLAACLLSFHNLKRGNSNFIQASLDSEIAMTIFHKIKQNFKHFDKVHSIKWCEVRQTEFFENLAGWHFTRILLLFVFAQELLLYYLYIYLKFNMTFLLDMNWTQHKISADRKMRKMVVSVTSLLLQHLGFVNSISDGSTAIVDELFCSFRAPSTSWWEFQHLVQLPPLLPPSLSPAFRPAHESAREWLNSVCCKVSGVACLIARSYISCFSRWILEDVGRG